MSDLFEITRELNQEPKLDEFIGEGKKYDSAEKALASIPHKEAHIVNLENQIRVLNEELAKRADLDKVLESLS